MNSISKFHSEPFINALKAFFEELKVPVDYLADEPASAADILGERFKATNEAHKLITDVYALGMVNDAIFYGTETFKNLAQVKKLKADYDGLLLFGVTLKNRKDGLPITRSHLAEITRAFNRTLRQVTVSYSLKACKTLILHAFLFLVLSHKVSICINFCYLTGYPLLDFKNG